MSNDSTRPIDERPTMIHIDEFVRRICFLTNTFPEYKLIIDRYEYYYCETPDYLHKYYDTTELIKRFNQYSIEHLITRDKYCSENQMIIVINPNKKRCLHFNMSLYGNQPKLYQYYWSTNDIHRMLLNENSIREQESELLPFNTSDRTTTLSQMKKLFDVLYIDRSKYRMIFRDGTNGETVYI